ncbi:MAG TPA: hypothetical protein DCQ98_04050 [Planctomycetaceae bacterium]|nr:hypothetical protein [Planctomycetaceae bacterium]
MSRTAWCREARCESPDAAVAAIAASDDFAAHDVALTDLNSTNRHLADRSLFGRRPHQETDR